MEKLPVMSTTYLGLRAAVKMERKKKTKEATAETTTIVVITTATEVATGTTTARITRRIAHTTAKAEMDPVNKDAMIND